MNIIPAIDLRNGQCVRLFQGDFAQQTDYAFDPVTLARDYARHGMAELHVVDLDGAQSGRQQNRDIVRQIVADSGLRVQLGGGLRERSRLESWFELGIARAVIGTLAVTDAPQVRDWMTAFGADRIVLALDVNLGDDGVPRVATHGWTRAGELTLWECLDGYADTGLQQLLCTDISRDGAMAGPNFGLYQELSERYPGVRLQASGGVRSIGDLDRLRAGGAAAAICGRALLDGSIDLAEIRQFLRAA